MGKKIIICEEELIKEYLETGSMTSTAKKFKCNHQRVKNILAKNSIELIRWKNRGNGSVKWPKEKLYNRTKESFVSGKINNLHEHTIRKYAKRILIYENGNKCSICGVENWCGVPVPLVCDHIDGNSENHNFNNFRLVCCNCDALLPTFKSKNKGRGRKYRTKFNNKGSDPARSGDSLENY